MINKKYSAIVFDLGQVLVSFDYKYFVEKVNKHKAGIGEQFLELYKNNYDVHRDFEKGMISEKDFIGQMLKYLGHIIDGETFCKYWSDIFSLNENIIALLPILKKDYKLYLLSNTNSIHKRYGYENYEFLKMFDGIFLSHEVGYIKPEEEIYRAVEKVSGFPSEEHIFIDDIKEYVDTAINIGWDGIQFIGYDDLVMNFKSKKVWSNSYMTEVINDKQGSRFVMDVEGDEVYLLYAEDKETLDLYSTFTPTSLRGQGLAVKVVIAALEYAKENKLRVIPSCWYVKKFLEKHTEFQGSVK